MNSEHNEDEVEVNKDEKNAAPNIDLCITSEEAEILQVAALHLAERTHLKGHGIILRRIAIMIDKLLASQ